MDKLTLLKTFVIVIEIFVSGNGESNGISIGRILNGNTTKTKAWSWHVIISKATNDNVPAYLMYDLNFIGGGSLINNRWVLTAAHLFRNMRNQTDYVLTFGMHQKPSFFDAVPPSIKMFRSNKILLHPNFKVNNSKDFDYDIALIAIGYQYKITYYKNMLKSGISSNFGSVNFTEYIQPVRLLCTKTNCLTERLKIIGKLIGEDTEEKQCRRETEILYRINLPTPVVVTGFGSTKAAMFGKTNADLARNLMKANLNIYNKTYCKNFNDHRIPWNNTIKTNFTERMFCATGTGKENARVDTCTGDSGGAVVRKVVFNDGPDCWVQIGIVSWGWGCGQFVGENSKVPVPGFYTKLSSFISWISTTMNNTNAMRPIQQQSSH